MTVCSWHITLLVNVYYTNNCVTDNYYSYSPNQQLLQKNLSYRFHAYISLYTEITLTTKKIYTYINCIDKWKCKYRMLHYTAISKVIIIIPLSNNHIGLNTTDNGQELQSRKQITQVMFRELNCTDNRIHSQGSRLH